MLKDRKMKKYLRELKREIAFLLALVMLFDLNLTGITARADDPADPVVPEYTNTVYWYYAEDEQCLELSTERYADRTTPSEYFGKLDVRKKYTEESIPWAGVRENIAMFRVDPDSDPVVPYYTACWFSGMENLQYVSLEGLDTSGVVDFSYMFAGCDLLPGLYDGCLDTSMAVSLQGLFSGCGVLTTVKTEYFNTASVEDFSYMFEGCESLSSVDISGFSSASALTMEQMFACCPALEAFLPGKDFTCSLVQNMNYMFLGCESLTDVDLSGMTPAALKSTVGMFENCTSLEAVSLEDLAMTKIASMSNMFRGCSSLASVNFDGVDTPRLKTLDNLFADCISLESADLSDLTYGDLKSLSNMFLNCESLQSVKLPVISNVSNLTDLSGMFSGCRSMENLAFRMTEKSAAWNVIEIDTSAVTDMSYLLENCENLKTLVLDINMQNVRRLDGMLSGCDRLTTFTKGGSTKLSVKDTGSYADLGAPDPWYVDGADGCWYWIQNDTAVRYLPDEIPDKQTSVTYQAYFGKVEYTAPDYGESLTDWVYYDDVYTVLGDEDEAVPAEERNPFGIVRDTASPMWSTAKGTVHAKATYSELSEKLSILDRTFSIIWKDTVKATYSVVWKNGDAVLEEDEAAFGLIPEYHGEVPVKTGEGIRYKFTGWTPSPAPVTDDQTYYATFAKALTVTWMLDQDTVWATESVVNGEVPSDPGIPEKASSGGFDYEFLDWDDPDALETPITQDTVYTAKFKKTSTIYLYWGLEEKAGGLKLIISATPSESAKHRGYFRKDDEFASYYEEGHTINAPWYYYRKQITEAEVSWDGENSSTKAKPFSTHGWFAALTNLASVDLSGLDTSSVTDMGEMFSGCGKLTSLDVSGFQTDKVENFREMFADCKRLSALDVSGFNTASATDMGMMFYNVFRVKTLNVEGFDTSKVESFYGMFRNCYYLETVHVGGFNTENVRDFGSMFEGCAHLEDFAFSGFRTNSLENARRMFYGCRSVGDLDLSGFAIHGTDAYTEMLSGMARLSTITLGDEADLSTAALATPSGVSVEDAEGYWFDDDNRAYDDTTTLPAGKTYRAVYGWVEYAPNGGTGETFREKLYYRDIHYALPKQQFTKTGKVFVGWSRVATESQTAEYKANQTIGRTDAGGVKGFASLLGVTLYATWTDPKENYGTVYWRDYDEKTVLKQEEVKYGTVPTPPADPTRPATKEFIYTFKEWTPEIKEVSKAQTFYTAVYTETRQTYTVTWKNQNEVLETDYNVPYGATAEYNGNPPVKQEDESYAYEFSGWSPSDQTVKGNVTFYAQFTPHKKPVVTGYTITWMQDDGETVLGKTFTKIGDVPEYGMTPTKASTTVYNYTFSHWTPTPEPVTKEATYTAVYNAVKRIYSVNYDLQGHGSGEKIVRKERVDSLLTRPADPADSSFNFKGWYLDQALTQKLDFASYHMPDRDITVYAAWEKKTESGPTGGGSTGGGTVSTRELNANAKGATFSSRWTAIGGKWIYPGRDGNPLRSCWLCDDAVVSNRFDVWYLLGEDGTMLDAGLVQDLTGNFYSLEMRHNGYYGMLRYQDGYYDGIYLKFEHEHNGRFGAILNQDGIEALKKKYGVTVFNIDNRSCIYTSSYEEMAPF